MNVEKWAYLAGLIDGDGCIRLAFTSGTTNKGSKRQDLFLLLQVTNTSAELMDWLQKTFEGKVYPLPRSSPKHKPTWVWNVTGDKVPRGQRHLPIAMEVMEMRREAVATMHLLNRKGA